MYEYHAVLIKVVDGDTMHLSLDLGLDTFMNVKVRVAGVNAPELKTTQGQSSKVWAINWFQSHPGKLLIKTFKDRQEKYGRYLARITAADGHVFNDDLLAAGMAVPYHP